MGCWNTLPADKCPQNVKSEAHYSRFCRESNGKFRFCSGFQRSAPILWENGYNGQKERKMLEIWQILPLRRTPLYPDRICQCPAPCAKKHPPFHQGGVVGTAFFLASLFEGGAPKGRRECSSYDRTLPQTQLALCQPPPGGGQVYFLHRRGVKKARCRSSAPGNISWQNPSGSWQARNPHPK